MQSLSRPYGDYDTPYSGEGAPDPDTLRRRHISRCDGEPTSACPVARWCVCQWAFALYLERAAGGCDRVERVDCNATNAAVVAAYEARS